MGLEYNFDILRYIKILILWFICNLDTASTSVYKSGNVTEGESDDSTFRATKSNTNAVVPIDTSDKTLYISLI